jgi:hypothetical protein
MKTKLPLTQILAAILIFSLSIGSAHSQQVISSINVNETVKSINDIVSIESESSEIVISKSENWMSNASYLDASSSLILYKLQLDLNKPVIESEKQLENWMFDDRYWIIEEHGIIEDWMLDEEFWKIQQVEEYTPIEDWMTNDDFWVMVN